MSALVHTPMSLNLTFLLPFLIIRLEAKTVDPYSVETGTGVLGRVSEILDLKGYSTNKISIDSSSVAVTPSRAAASPLIVSRQGAKKFYERRSDEQWRVEETLQYVLHLNNETSLHNSFFGETWSDQFTTGLSQADTLKTALDQTTLGPQWLDDFDPAQKLSMIARLMKTRQNRGVDRDFYYTEYGGWDHHVS